MQLTVISFLSLFFVFEAFSILWFQMRTQSQIRLA